ncbi:hypothetical protein CEXT_510971 [Caerostris extrusa]|uniref:Uncharacterized protein n=1 Tax=Caerostris extrusa TaxID=172846 RepID=A0AAV4XJ65_CAEEX|nr:hypothetical protein CEXT_510971 [Caerostris extrusa]
MKKEKTTEKETKAKTAAKLPKPASKVAGVQSPVETSRTPTPPSKFIAKHREPKAFRPTKTSTPIKATPKTDTKPVIKLQN